MSKVHPIWSLIQSLDPTEKSYFKKFGFKKESKHTESYKVLFDLIDKQSEFSLDKLNADKRLSSSIKNNLHANLNNLQKRIVQSVLDSRRSSNELAGIFEAILELKFFNEKKLFSLAKSRISSLRKLVLNNDFYYMKPQINFIAYEMLRKRNETNIPKRVQVLDEFVNSLVDFNVISDTQVIGLKLENIYFNNSGAFIKDEADAEQVQELIAETKALLALEKKDFQLKSILYNNLYILSIMGGKWEDFQSLTDQMLWSYKDNMSKKTVAKEYHDFLIVLVNLAHICIKYELDTAASESFEILKRDRILIREARKKEEMDAQINLLELQYFAFNKVLENGEESISYFLQGFEAMDMKNANYPSYLVNLCMAYYKLGECQALLDLSADYALQDKREYVQGVHLCIRIFRALAWLKLENIDMFEADMKIALRLAPVFEDSKFISGTIRYFKRLPNLNMSVKKEKELKELLAEFNDLKLSKAPSEFLQSRIFYDMLRTEARLS